MRILYGMERYEKVYVSMILRVNQDGVMRPVAVEWTDGRRYDVQKISDVRMSPPRFVGGVLTRRYRVVIGGREKFLYLETGSNRWFVEKLSLT